MTGKKIPPRRIAKAAESTPDDIKHKETPPNVAATGREGKRLPPPRRKAASTPLISQLGGIEFDTNKDGMPTAPFIESQLDSPAEFFERWKPAAKLDKSITTYTDANGDVQKLRIPVTNKNAGGYIVPIMKGGRRLKGAHVKAQQVFPFDFDEQLPGTMRKIEQVIQKLNWGYVLYTTASNGQPMKARPDIAGERFRLILVAVEPVGNTGEESGDAILCRRAIMARIEGTLRTLYPDHEDLVVDPHTYTPKQRMYLPVHGSAVHIHDGPALDGAELVKWGRAQGITAHFKAARPGAVVDPKIAGIFAPVVEMLAKLGAEEHGAGRYLLQACDEHASGYTTESKFDDFAFMLPEQGVADVFNISAIHGSDQDALDDINSNHKGAAARKEWFDFCAHAVAADPEDAEDLLMAITQCCQMHKEQWVATSAATIDDMSFDDDDDTAGSKPARRVKQEDKEAAAEGELIPSVQSRLEQLSKRTKLKRLTDASEGLPVVDGLGDLSSVKLGCWWNEQPTGELIIVPAGEAAEDLNKSVGVCLASHNETKRGEHHGVMVYDGKVWHPFLNIGNQVIRETVRQGVPASANWVELMISSLRLNLDNRLGDPLEGAVPFDNGVLLTQGPEAGQMVPHRPDMWLRSTNGITWQDEQPTPVFDAWLDFVTNGREEMRQAIRAMFWHVLTGEPRLKAFYEITGESNTGKSVVSNMCVLLAGGQENVLPMDMETLADMNGGGRFALAELPGKRLVMMAEQSSGRFRTSRLKMMTGGDPVRVEIKGGGSFSWVNRAPIVITNNQAMVFKEDNANQAIINRRVLIAVNRVVPANRRDPNLLEKLRGELGGIAFQLLRDFSATTATRALNEWKDKSDDLIKATRELDSDFEFAAMLEPILEDVHSSKTWKVGIRPKDEDLRNGTIDAAAEVGLYPLYVHYRKAIGEQQGTLSNRKFAATMLNHLQTLHRKDRLPAALFKKVPNVPVTRLRWAPSAALIDLLTQSSAAGESLDFE